MGPSRARGGGRAERWHACAWAFLAITALAAVLRFQAFSKVHANPYYDAAVRSMEESWHNLFFGAAEPAAGVSVDKAPLDLWLQVASVKLLGFTSTALRLPEALAGTAAVPVLYDLVRRLFGGLAGLIAALALAVMPAAVLTARSDTMDSLMMLCMVLAAWCVVRGLGAERHELAWLAGGGVALGLAFEVKLFESLVIVPALVALYLLGSSLAVRRRLRHLATAGLVFLVTALAWPVAVSLAPARERPYPLGSTDGSVWNVIFVFNGVGRLGQNPGVYGVGARRTAIRQSDRGLRRFFSASPTDYRSLIGTELLAALALGALALIAHASARPRGAWRAADRHRRAGAAFLGTWLVTGALGFSLISVMLPRYLEAFTPAVAGTLGVGATALGGLMHRRWLMPIGLVTVAAVSLNFLLRHQRGTFVSGAGVDEVVAAALVLLALVALLAAWRGVGPRLSGAFAALVAGLASVAILLPPADAARSLSLTGRQDSGTPGRRPVEQTARLSAYLRAHRGGARYEVATHGVGGVSALIVRDGLPVLFLSNLGRQPLVPLRRFVSLVRSGQVRYVLVGACPPRSHSSACDPTGNWTRRHGRDVSPAVGLPPQSLYRVGLGPARSHR